MKFKSLETYYDLNNELMTLIVAAQNFNFLKCPIYRTVAPSYLKIFFSQCVYLGSYYASEIQFIYVKER